MSVFHFKHFLKGRRGRSALKELYANMFINSEIYSPIQYRLVLREIAINSSNSGQSSSDKLLENIKNFGFTHKMNRVKPFLTVENFEGKGKWNLH